MLAGRAGGTRGGLVPAGPQHHSAAEGLCHGREAHPMAVGGQPLWGKGVPLTLAWPGPVVRGAVAEDLGPELTSRCPLLGRLLIEFTSPMSMERVQRENPDVREGGKYVPLDCQPRQKVAILIPFRHREHHLRYWLHYLHPILRRQKVAYGIYVINQYGEETFNRAKLLNVGFLEALKDEDDYGCFIFSDVDLVPMDDRNLYRCYEQPRHFAIAMDKFSFRLPYAGYFGGVSGLSRSQFLKINGFPNEYWGWGGEDDDIFNRWVSVSRPDVRIGRYRMIKHERDRHNEPNPQRFTKIQNTKLTMKRDGISSLQYRLVELTRWPMYTNVTVDIGKPPPRPARG
uniref:Beta-1,4-galactosyltransferase n=1 Tax=Pelusios castaneus TaxID=367368 RepID=A0A8C8VLH6_9SAUR